MKKVNPINLGLYKWDDELSQILRGGNWKEHEDFASFSLKDNFEPQTKFSTFGFRICRTTRNNK